VIDTQLNLEVFDEVAPLGGVAMFRCHLSSEQQAAQVEVEQWLRDDKVLAGLDAGQLARKLAGSGPVASQAGGPKGGLSRGGDHWASRGAEVASMQQQQQHLQELQAPEGPKYLVLAGGELVVRNVVKSDAGQYKCRARHKLTGRRLASAVGGQLLVEEQRAASSQEQQAGVRALDPLEGRARVQLVGEGADLLLCAKFSLAVRHLQWFARPARHSSDAHGKPADSDWEPVGPSGTFQSVQDATSGPLVRPMGSCLLLGRVQARQAGEFACEARDQRGGRARASFRLLVALASSARGRLEAQLAATPPHTVSGQETREGPLLVPLGAPVQLNCSLQERLLAGLDEQPGNKPGELGVQLNELAAQPALPARLDAVDWLKDGQLVARWRASNGSFSDEPEHESATGSAILSHSARDRLRLVGPRSLLLERFQLADRGVYQCQLYAANGSKRRKRRQLGARNTLPAADTSSYAAMWAARLEGALERALRSGSQSAAVQLEPAFQRPQLLERFPALQQARDQQPGTLTLQCLASGVPAPRISWFLDDFPIVDRRAGSAGGEEASSITLSSGELAGNSRELPGNSREPAGSLGEPLDPAEAELWGPAWAWPLEMDQKYQQQQGESVIGARGPVNASVSVIDEGRPAIEAAHKFRISSQWAAMEAKLSWRSGGPDGLSSLVRSQLNISALRLTESGVYKCLASNAWGQAVHQGRLRVLPASRVPIGALPNGSSSEGGQEGQGQAGETATALMRNYQPSRLTVMAGQQSVWLQCPLVGFPLRQVAWFFKGQRLPLSHRQRVEPVRDHWGGRLELSRVDEAKADQGVYTCALQLDLEESKQQFHQEQSHQERSQQVSQQRQLDTQTDTSGQGNHVSNGSRSSPSLSGRFVAQLGEVQLSVRVAPLIDAQLLPQVVEADEGMRTKLVCSVVRGDRPIQIGWFRRRRTLPPSSGWTDDQALAPVGFEPLLAATDQPRRHQTSQNEAQNEAPKELQEATSGSTSGSASGSTSGASLEPQGVHAAQSAGAQVLQLDDSALLTFGRVSAGDEGEYLCVARNQFSAARRQVRLLVHQAPRWSIEPPSELAVLLGQPLQLDCLAHGNPPPQAFWSRQRGQPALPGSATVSESTLSGAGGSGAGNLEFGATSGLRWLANGTLALAQVERADAGSYMCEQANGVGGGLSKVVRVRVQVPPRFRPEQRAVVLARLGERAELSCVAEGDQPLLVGWRKEELEVDLVGEQRQRRVTESRLDEGGALRSSLSIANVSRLDSGPYSCVASNELGTEQLRLLLLVQEAPEAPSRFRLPVRAEARSAWLAFERPFAGNSPIRKYALELRPLGLGEAALPQNEGALPLANLSSAAATQEASLEATSEATSADRQQVLLEAPPSSSVGASGQAGGTGSASNESLVELSVCCLRPFTRYLVRLRAINELGASPPSEPLLLTTDEETIGGPPLEVGVEATGAHSLKVHWQPPARHLRNGLVRGYYIGYRALGASLGSLELAASSASSASASGDPQQQQQQQQFQYKNVQLDALTSASSTSGGLQMAPLAPPSNADPKERQNSSSAGPQLFTSYLTNLRRKTTYAVIVQAYNKVGAGPRSDQIVVSTLDAAPPMSPQLRLLQVSHSAAQFGWTSGRFGASGTGGSSASGKRGTSGAGPANQQLGPQQLQEPMPDDDDPQAFLTISFRLDPMLAGASDQPPAALEWQQRRVAKTASGATSGALGAIGAQPGSFWLQNLRCGSAYLAFMTATNSLGQSEPGDTLRFQTLGGVPRAPSHAHHFLQVNATFLLLRLDAWRPAGCPLSSFRIRYRQLAPNQQQQQQQAASHKWLLVEHQLLPTPHTVSVSGAPVYATQTHRSLGQAAAAPFPPPQTPFRPQLQEGTLASQSAPLGELVLRNLQPMSEYRLLVEALCEAGSTSAEYQFETANMTASLLAVNSNGLVAPDDRSASLVAGGQSGAGEPEGDPDADPSLRGASLFGGAHRGGPGGLAAGPLQQHYSLGVWSLTLLFVLASILMALVTLVVGLRSVWRLRRQHQKPPNARPSPPIEPCGAPVQSARRAHPNNLPRPPQGHLWSLLWPGQCGQPAGEGGAATTGSSASSSSSSTGGCSSSSAGGVGGGPNGHPLAGCAARNPSGHAPCYQATTTGEHEDLHLASLEPPYCSLPAHNGGLLFADHPQGEVPHSPSDFCLGGRLLAGGRGHGTALGGSLTRRHHHEEHEQHAGGLSSLGPFGQQLHTLRAGGQLAPSGSLSTINHISGRGPGSGAATLRHHSHTLAGKHAALAAQQQQALDAQDCPGGSPKSQALAAGNLLRAHYAATLARQHLQSTTFSTLGANQPANQQASQPAKFPQTSQSPPYGQLGAPLKLGPFAGYLESQERACQLQAAQSSGPMAAQKQQQAHYQASCLSYEPELVAETNTATSSGYGTSTTRAPSLSGNPAASGQQSASHAGDHMEHQYGCQLAQQPAAAHDHDHDCSTAFQGGQSGQQQQQSELMCGPEVGSLASRANCPQLHQMHNKHQDQYSLGLVGAQTGEQQSFMDPYGIFFAQEQAQQQPRKQL